jgi:glutamate/tyrosine decarboxylase-like PLP-dependent enzyme
MTIPDRREDSPSACFQADARLAALAASPSAPTLDVEGTRKVEAWFLGPRGENAEEFERLVVDALRDHVYWRRNYHPGDPSHITEEIKREPDYLQAMGRLRDEHGQLLALLKRSVPFFSMRYQGHMNWDLTLPGMLGYFSAMLYNPNNVALEGSTATTLIELVVGDDLCRMLGYRVPSTDEIARGAVRPWGHITCDGTVANIEALWAARNLKFYPFAVREAIAQDPAMEAARDLRILLPGGTEKILLELTPWELLNLTADEVLALPNRIVAQHRLDASAVAATIGAYSLQRLGLPGFFRRFLGDMAHDPVVLISGSRHYSHPKAAALLGLGEANLINLPVDLDARLDVDALDRQLDQCLHERRPVIAVVGVVGSTEESAVDPLARIAALRVKYAALGLTFHLHADAAWGGYHRSLVNEPFALPAPDAVFAPPIAAPLSRYVVEQLQAMGRADSITVDPHKSGYIPYPAGSLCYRNGAMRNLVAFSAPVVFHGEAEQTVGIYGVEGSKPGAAAAAVYLSHRVIRPTPEGYGKIIGEALFSCRKLYARLLTMFGPGDPFVVVPLARLPAERTGGDPQAQKALVKALIDERSTEEILANPEALNLLREIGPDQNIFSYAFNFRRPDGCLNADLAKAKALNTAIYKRLSIKPGDDIYGYNLIVSTTDLDTVVYGSPFIDDYKRRLGVAGSPGNTVTVIRSVVMDPWVTEIGGRSFIDILAAEYRKAVQAALQTISSSSRSFGGY